MTGPAHLLFGAAAAVPLAAATNQPVWLLAGALGGLWPDLDLSEATLANWRLVIRPARRGQRALSIRPFSWLAALARATGEHRGWWHTVPALLLFGAIAVWLGGWPAGGSFIFGYASHLLADSLTPAGLAVWGTRRWHPLPARHRIPTDSAGEHLLSALAAVLILIYLLPALFQGVL